MIIIIIRTNAVVISVSVVIIFSSYTFFPLVIEIRLKKAYSLYVRQSLQDPSPKCLVLYFTLKNLVPLTSPASFTYEVP